MEDANAIMARLAVSTPFLKTADVLEKIETAHVTEAVEAAERAEREAAEARRWASLEAEHEKNVADRGGYVFEDDRPQHSGPIEESVLVAKGSTLSLWVDHHHVKAALKIPMNGTWFMRFRGLEKPVLDKLYLQRITGADYAFCTMVNYAFVDEARQDNATNRSNTNAVRFQGSTVSRSQYDDLEIVSTAFARLYWDGDRPTRVILLDGSSTYSFDLTPFRGDRWDSPTHTGALSR